MIFVAAVLLVLVAGTSGYGQDGDPVAALVAAATRYVEDYERNLSALVGEVHETQRVIRADGTVKKERALVADVLLVKSGDRTQSFRDVISVDGKPVRDREERLRKLFLGEPRTRDKQMHAIASESSRYDIGVQRGMDTLMLPLAILHPETASGFRFERSANGLTFTEFRSPALVRSRNRSGVKDMFLRGVFMIEPGGVAVHSATLNAQNDVFEVTVATRYDEDAAARLLVPVESTETYRQTGNPKADRTEVSSSYSKFRRFQVNVDEQVTLPQP